MDRTGLMPDHVDARRIAEPDGVSLGTDAIAKGF